MLRRDIEQLLTVLRRQMIAPRSDKLALVCGKFAARRAPVCKALQQRF
jgi:hypothetical protein